jgi:hypothetical protein
MKGWGKWIWLAGLILLGLTHRAEAATATCRMSFSLEEWSVFYESATGQGEIRCSNGQSAAVSIRAKGGGLTVGKSRIANGEGRFSPVEDISELFGSYGSASANAGIGPSSAARVVTKGTVSLALSGTGQGVDLGIDFGNFVIEKVAPKAPKKK